MKKLLVFLSLAMMINIQTAHGDDDHMSKLQQQLAQRQTKMAQNGNSSTTSTTQVQSANAATQTEDTIYTENDMLECSICISTLTREDTITTTPCGHVFCQSCLQASKEAQQATNADPSCPNCRALLNTPEKEIDRGEPLNDFSVLMAIGATYFLTTNNTSYTDIAKKSTALFCIYVLADEVVCTIEDKQRNEEEISMLENLISKGAANIAGAAIVGLCLGATVGSIKATSRLCGSFLFNN